MPLKEFNWREGCPDYGASRGMARHCLDPGRGRGGHSGGGATKSAVEQTGEGGS